MHYEQKKCPSCKSPIVKKDGKRKSIQRYKCMACGLRFSGGVEISKEKIWEMYLYGKQTVAQISEIVGLSPSTIKRRLSEISFDWKQPEIKGCGVVHLDATYFGRNTGVLLALENSTGRILYMAHIAHEHISDYEIAVEHIRRQGYIIKGIVIDGLQKLFKVFAEYRIQMCQFHMVAIIRRKLTKNPQLQAGKELLDLAYRLKLMKRQEFVMEFEAWKKKWYEFLKEKTINEQTGRTIYTHQRLRSAMLSITTYIPYLFTFEEIDGMPNTNNMIEGTFTDMKKALRNHPGMSAQNRKRMMNGFFLAYEKLHNTNGDDL